MEETRSQLDPQRVEGMDAILERQTRESFEWIRELDGQLTRTNFLTNGGAAIATLAFIGTGTADREMAWPLALFTVGTVATGIELRSLLGYFGALHKEAIRRRRGFLNDELRVKDLLIPSDFASRRKRLNHWAGWISQICFIAGVILTAWVLSSGA